MASTTSPTSSVVGIGEVERRETLARILEAQHREIGAAVLEHDLGLELALVGQRDLHLIRALDDVIVGDDEARGIDHDAGAERALHLLGLLAGNAEEAAEDRVVSSGLRRLHDRGERQHRVGARLRRHPQGRRLRGDGGGGERAGENEGGGEDAGAWRDSMRVAGSS
jgi:hypothetical protein